MSPSFLDPHVLNNVVSKPFCEWCFITLVDNQSLNMLPQLSTASSPACDFSWENVIGLKALKLKG